MQEIMSARSLMPVLVEVPVNHEAVKEMPEELQFRINFKKSTEEVAADSERMSARSELLREAHLQSVRERAARETQRGEEASARKRRVAAEDLRKLEEKIQNASAKTETRKREQQEKRDAEKLKRSAMAEAVRENRQETHVATIKKGIEKATRACAAVTAREKKVAEVVMRSGAQVKHALAVAASKKDKKESGDDEMHLDSPHPVSIMDTDRLASPHPVHHQHQQQVEAQLQLHNPSALQKLMSSTPTWAASATSNDHSTNNSSRSSTPRKSMTPRQPSMMTISEDRELMTDHRSLAFERCWFKEQTASGKLVWSYVIRWDDGTSRIVRARA